MLRTLVDERSYRRSVYAIRQGENHASARFDASSSIVDVAAGGMAAHTVAIA